MTKYYYTTPTLVEAQLRASAVFDATTTPSVTSVSEWIAEESATINQTAGMVFGLTQYTTLLDYHAEETLQLKHAPIISVDSLTYSTTELGSDGYSDSFVSKTEDTDFTVYNEAGEIEFMFKSFNPADGKKRFRCIYTAGYSTLPDTITKLATKMTALRVLDSLIHANVNDRNDGGSISVGSISIIEPASYGVSSYDALKSDIEMLNKEIVKGTGAYRYERWQ